MKRFVSLAGTLSILLTLLPGPVVGAGDLVPAAPTVPVLAGKGGDIAFATVFRIICPSKDRNGTGFLHKSGRVITAAHVVEGCSPSEIMLFGTNGLHIGSNGKSNGVTQMVTNAVLDLALFTPKDKINARAFPIDPEDDHLIGTLVSTWGYPGGYHGTAPLLSTGYIAGVDQVPARGDRRTNKFVINAAFNLGNSGGPLLDIGKGTVIGVVSSKLVPLPPEMESALAALKKDKSTIAFRKTRADGTQVDMSEAQVVEEVLDYLRSQMQLVIGHAVMTSDLKEFLRSNGVRP